MGYVSVVTAVVLLCLAANAFSAEIEDQYGLTEPTNLSKLPELSGSVVTTTNFNGFSAAAISGAWTSQVEQPKIFYTEKLFASASAASVHANFVPGSQPDYYGRASIGMFGQLLPSSTLRYTWSVNTLFWAGTGNDVRIGIHDRVTEHIVLGINGGRTFDSPFGAVSFADVYADYLLSEELQIGIEHGYRRAGVFNGYSYTSISATKDWSADWTTELSYTNVKDGSAGKYGAINEELLGQGTRLTVMYKF